MIKQYIADNRPLPWTFSIDEFVANAVDSNLWYGLGRFSLGGTVTIERAVPTSNGRYRVEGRIDFSMRDRYDWHEGLEAGGDVSGIQFFPDTWQAWMVDIGWAREFDVTGQLSRPFVSESGFYDVYLPSIGR